MKTKKSGTDRDEERKGRGRRVTLTWNVARPGRLDRQLETGFSGVTRPKFKPTEQKNDRNPTTPLNGRLGVFGSQAAPAFPGELRHQSERKLVAIFTL
jgi:hypothetical protein